MFCAKCGKQIEVYGKFCPGCGAPLPPLAPPAQQNSYAPQGQLNAQQSAYAPQAQPYAQANSYAAQQQPYAQQYAYAPQGSYAPQPSAQQPRRQSATPQKRWKKKKKGLRIGALIGIIAGGAALLAALVFFGIRLFGSASAPNNAPEPKAAGGTWSGVLSFDAYFPEDGTSSALAYASDEGTLACTLHADKSGKAAELVVKDVTIPLSVEKTAYAIRFTGDMAGEAISLDAKISGEDITSLSGKGAVTTSSEELPLSFTFTQLSDKAPEISGSASGALPSPQ